LPNGSGDYFLAFLPMLMTTSGAHKVPASNSVLAFDLNFVEVAVYYTNFRSRLLSLLDSAKNEVSMLQIISSMHECPLERWLHSIGKDSFAHIPAFQHLLDAHFEFQNSVDTILAKASANNLAGAGALLRNEFSQSTRRVLIALNDLNEVVHPITVSPAESQ
jgi:hypothetical protein